MTRTTFPTMADVARAQWPTGMVVTEPDRTHLGAVALLRCERPNCYRLVPSEEMHDFRELSPSQLAALGITHAYMCAACFHVDSAHGKLIHSDVARVMALHADVIASLDWRDAYATQRGHIVTTAKTQHFHAVRLPQGTIPNPNRLSLP